MALMGMPRLSGAKHGGKLPFYKSRGVWLGVRTATGANPGGSERGKKGAVTGLPLNDIEANTLLVELTNTGLGNFGN